MEEKVQIYLYWTSLDDIVHCCNIMGRYPLQHPVVLSYLVIDKTEIRLLQIVFSRQMYWKLWKRWCDLFSYDSIYEYGKHLQGQKSSFPAKRKSTVVWLAIFRQTPGFWMKKILHSSYKNEESR